MTKQTYPPRIMYMEYKGDGLHGSARIGRVTFSRTGASLYYNGKTFSKLGGSGFKANYADENGEQYWISGPRRDGVDRLYKSDWPVEIDEDVREKYWTEIRRMPESKDRKTTSLSTTKRPDATKLTRT